MNLGPETEKVEHKKSTSELKEGIASIASILNKHGEGTLYFGVLNNGDVAGQQVSDTTLREVSQAIAHSIEPPVYPTIEKRVADDGREYVCVMFEGHDAPYACKNAYRIRVADEDRPMEPDKLESMMLERAYRKKPWDAQPSSRPLSDVDESALRKFVERGRERGRIKFEYTDVEDVLSRLGLYRDGRMLNAADVLFCPSEGTQLKMGVFVDHRRIEVLDMQHESGTLFDLVDAAELYILNNIRRRFVFTGARTRDEVPEIPRKVIREALLNAYAHRLWTRRSYVQVDIYHDAVDIISPGWFIDGQFPEAHLEGKSTSSETRNELIAKTLFRSGDIESSGLGMRMIRELCEEAGVKVTYEQIDFGTKLTFHRNDPYLTGGNEGENSGGYAQSTQKYAEVRAKYANGLSSAELKALDYIASKGVVTNKQVAEAIGLSVSGSLKLLRRLATKGLVLRHGESKATGYSLADLGVQEE